MISSKLILIVFIVFVISSLVIAKDYTQDYNDGITKGIGNTIWCKLTGCVMSGDIDMGNYSVINANWVNATYYNVSVNITDVVDIHKLCINTSNITCYYANNQFHYGYNGSAGSTYACINSSNITCHYDGTNWQYTYNGSGGGGADNLGNHIATQNIDARTYNITANNFYGNNSQTATIIVSANNSLNRYTADFQCTGTNDDVCIESAMNALPAGGGKVFLLEGTYNLGNQIDIIKNNLLFSGSGTSTILTGTSSNGIFFDDQEDITIQNVLFKGFPNNNCIATDMSNLRMTIRNNNFIDCNKGVLVATFDEPFDRARIEGNYFYNNSRAIEFEDGDDIYITNNFIEDSRAFDILLQFTNRVHLVGNKLDGNLGTGGAIQINGDGGSGTGNFILNNQFINTNKYAIRTVTSIEDTTISGNIITDSGDNAIQLEGSDNNLVNSNRIEGTTGYAINIGAGSTGTMIVANNLYGNTNTILDSGTSSTIIGNYPGGSSMEIQTATGEEILMKPYGTRTGNWTPKRLQIYGNITSETAFLTKIAMGILNPLHTIDMIGDMLLTHNATSTDEHALEIKISANAMGDVKGIDLLYDTGAITTGQEEAVILINLDTSKSTGGEVAGLEILRTGNTAEVNAMFTGIEVNPILQFSGVFGNMDSANNTIKDNLTAFTSSTLNVEMFTNDNDYVTLGNTEHFEEIEFILNTTSSVNIKPTFEFSTGVDAWTTFTPTDGTNGFENTGVIIWLFKDIPTWAVGKNNEYLIKITRTKNNVLTPPIEELVQISDITEYYWNSTGDIFIDSITSAKFCLNPNSCINGWDEINLSGSASSFNSANEQITNITMFDNDTIVRQHNTSWVSSIVDLTFLQNLLDSVYLAITDLPISIGNKSIIRSGENESWVKNNQYLPTNLTSANVGDIIVNDTILRNGTNLNMGTGNFSTNLSIYGSLMILNASGHGVSLTYNGSWVCSGVC